MPLSQQQRDWVITQSGYDPSTHQLDDDGYISEKPRVAAQPVVSDRGTPQPKIEPMGAASTFVKEAIHSAPAAAIGGIGAVLGGAAGGALISGPLAPLGAVAGGVLGGLGLGGSASWAQNKIEQSVAPDYTAQMEANRVANPLSALGGRLSSLMVGGMNPNLPNVGRAAGDAVSRITGATSKLNPAQLANLGNVGIGAGLGTGIAVGQQLAGGKSLSDSVLSMDTLEGLVGGTLFNKPNAIGNRMGFHDVATSAPRITEDPRLAAMRAQMADAQSAAKPVMDLNDPRIAAAKVGLTEKKEGKAANLDKTDILSANQAAEQRGINPAKAAEMEAARVAQAGLLTPEQIYQQKVQKELERLQSLRRKADFEKATLELQTQQRQAQTEIEQAQAAKQQAKAQQQLGMKLGVQGTPEAIAARGITMLPENRPATPRGNNKRVAAMQAEMVDPLQDQADLIQERLERKNQEPDEVVPEDSELRQAVVASKANTPLDDFAKALFDARAKETGADVDKTTERGSFALLDDKLKRMAAHIGTAEGSDTRAHEVIGHIYNKMLELSPYASDKRIQRQMLKAASESPELAAINERRAAAGKTAWTSDEFVANQQGLEWLMRNASKESPNRAWFEQWKAGMKSVMSRANAADLRRLVDYKWHNDAPFSEYFGKHVAEGASSVGARVNQPADEGFNSKEGDDIFSNNEDVPVNDHTKPTAEAIAKAKELGYTYDGMQDFGVPGFEHHAFTRRDDAPGAKTKGATFYVPRSQTSTENIIKLAKAKTAAFENDGRVDQPSDESLPAAKGRTKEEHVVQQIKRNRKAKEELAAIRAAAEVTTARAGGYATDGGVGLVGPMPERNPSAANGAEGGRPEQPFSSRKKVSLQTPMASGKGTLADVIADPNAVMPGENIGDAELQSLPGAGKAAKPAKETLEERIARKADEQLARLNKAVPSSEAEQTVAKIVAPKPEATPLGDKGKLEISYAHMGEITEVKLDTMMKDRESLVEEHGEDSPQVEKIDAAIEKQQKMLEWIKTQKPEKMVDLKSISKVYQPSDEALQPKQVIGKWVRDYTSKPELQAKLQAIIDEGPRRISEHNPHKAWTPEWEAFNQRPPDWNESFSDAKVGAIKGVPFVVSHKTVFMRDAEGNWFEKLLFARNDNGTPATIEDNLVRNKAVPLSERQSSPEFGLVQHLNSLVSDVVKPELRRINQPSDEALPARPKDKTAIYEETGATGRGLLHTMGAEVDKLKAISPVAGKAAEDFLGKLRARRGELEGGFNYALKKVRKAQSMQEYLYQDNPDYQAVVKWRDAMMDGRTAGELTPTQKKINEVISDSLKQSLDLRESFKTEGDIEGLATGKKGSPNYLPHVMARDAANVLSESPTSPAAKKLFNDFIKYRTEVKGQTEAEATKNWNTIRDSFNQLEEGNVAARFGAIDKAMGKGLPVSMREQNLIDRMGRFNRRFARRVAYHETVQRNAEAHDAFFNSKDGIASTKVGKNILQDMFGIREHQEATRSAMSGVVRALMLGPLTGAKDVVAGQVLGLQHMGLAQVLPAKLAALKNYSDSYKKAVRTGVVREGYGGLESGEGGLKNLQSVMMRSRDIINQVQGRQMLETVSRVLNFGEGRHLTLDALSAIRQGRLDGTKRGFLDDFVPAWQKYKNGEVPEAVIDEAAAKFVESVQGTYDYRGLPAIAMKGTLSPYLSLARWNVEKFNNFTKNVVEPARSGNYKPMLMATLGAFIGGSAVNALVEEVTGRKERTAKWSEIAESKEQAGLIGYKLASLASLAGYAGMLGDIVKSGFDANYKNRVQTFSNPLVDAGGTILEDGKFLVQALQEGDLPAATDVLHMLATDYIQAYRIALPHVSGDKQKELEDTNKRRDLKVWKMGEGLPLPDSTTTRPNPLIGQDARRFKETEDMGEAAGLLPTLIDKAVKKATDAEGRINPEILKAELSKYKRNSYQTMPSFEQNPIAASQFMQFLGKTQGAAVASRRIEDYVRRNAINKAKSSMIPSM